MTGAIGLAGEGVTAGGASSGVVAVDGEDGSRWALLGCRLGFTRHPAEPVMVGGFCLER